MHAIEVTEDGTALAAYRDGPAWHLLGEVFTEHVDTAGMMRTAHLDNWDVRAIDASTLTPAAWDFVTPTFHIVRNRPGKPGAIDVLGTTGKRYVPLQNETAFAFGDYLLDGGAEWDSAASLFGGRRVFGALKVGKDVTIGGKSGETNSLWLTILTSHDGTMPLCAFAQVIRPVCWNTVSWGLASADRVHKVRHTASADGRMSEARESLQIAFSYGDAWAEEMGKLLRVRVSRDRFDQIVEAAYPRPTEDVKGSFTKWENRRDTLMSLFTGKGDTDTTGNVKGTAYGAVNALTERIDWHRTIRDGNVETMAVDAMGLGGPGDKEKQRLFTVVRDFVAA